MKRYNRAWKYTVGFMCEYEVIALLSGGKIPTWSTLTKKYPFIAPTILSGLFIHFYVEDRWAAWNVERKLNLQESSALQAMHVRGETKVRMASLIQTIRVKLLPTSLSTEGFTP
jgi:hypothetical protein